MKNSICLILTLSILFSFLPADLVGKSKDYFIKILIHEGSGMNQKDHRIKITPAKVVYYHRVFRFKRRSGVLQTRFVVKKSNPILVSGSRYYGRMIVIKSRKKLLLINEVPLETYLLGVISKEISYSWPIEAIKAQAVAARTYAINHLIKNKGKNYHIGNTTQFQVFNGVKDIHPNILQGVKDTRRVILTYDDEPIETFFHASCGGQTEEPQNVWASEKQKRYPYLKSVKCDFCTTHPRFQWEYSVKAQELQKKLKKYIKTRRLRGVKVTKKSRSGRATEVELVISGKKPTITGNDFRMAVGSTKILSTKFEFRKKNNEYQFRGFGYGHGVGMCQWGSKTMAEEGYSYERILSFYFKNTVLKRFKI